MRIPRHVCEVFDPVRFRDGGKLVCRVCARVIAWWDTDYIDELKFENLEENFEKNPKDAKYLTREEAERLR